MNLEQYIDRLVEARRLEKSLFPEKFSRYQTTLNQFRDFYSHNVKSFAGQNDFEDHQAIFNNYVLTKIQKYLASGQPLFYQCHTICNLIMLAVHKEQNPKLREYLLGLRPQITIGDVKVKGKFKYNVTEKYIRDVIEKGPYSTDFLALHVWFTLYDGTVIDPTIFATLAHEGKPIASEPNRTLLQPFGMNTDSDIEYYPMLIDDEFFFKVDRIRKII